MKRSFKRFATRLDKSGLRKGVEKRALALHVSLQELYEGARVPSIIAARRAVYLWLMQEGKSINEIAVLFDRAPNGVWKLTQAGASK
jgi:hypothetical protein